MQVKGTRVTREAVEIEVSPSDILDVLGKQLKQKWRVGHDWYINDKEHWEEWVDTGHGSGLTTVNRPATSEEMRAMRALKELRQISSGL